MFICFSKRPKCDARRLDRVRMSDEILPYSPVNIVGKIITKDDILEEFKDHSTVVIKSE
jgi:hypothetical protein